MRIRMVMGVALMLLTGCGGAPPPPQHMQSMMSASGQLATCSQGMSVVGGGFEIATEARVTGKIPTVVVNRPTENGWMVQCLDAAGSPSSACKAYVLCATVLQ